MRAARNDPLRAQLRGEPAAGVDDIHITPGQPRVVWEPPRDHLGKPLFLKKIDPDTFREIESIQVKGPCRFEISSLACGVGSYAAYIWLGARPK